MSLGVYEQYTSTNDNGMLKMSGVSIIDFCHKFFLATIFSQGVSRTLGVTCHILGGYENASGVTTEVWVFRVGRNFFLKCSLGVVESPPPH